MKQGSAQHGPEGVKCLNGLVAACSPDEADASGEHEEAVEVPDVHDLVDLVLREHGAADQQVQEQRPDAAVHVQHLRDQSTALEHPEYNMNGIEET